MLLSLTDWCSFDPGIIAATRHTGSSAELSDGKLITAKLNSRMDDFKYTGRVIHEQCTYFLEVLIEEIFFKKSTSCFR